MNSQEIRFNILNILYEKERKDHGRGMSSKDLLDKLSITEEELDFNINYVADKYWVKLIKFLGGNFIANITADGIDLVEDKDGLKSAFPSLQFIIQSGQINIANQNSDNNTTIVNVGYDVILRKADGLTNFTEVRTKIEAIKSEDEKPEDQRDSNIITKSWKYLKEHATEIVPMIEPIVKRLLGL